MNTVLEYISAGRIRGIMNHARRMINVFTSFRHFFPHKYFLYTHIEDSIYFNPIIAFLCAVNTILKYISAGRIRGIINHARRIINVFASFRHFFFPHKYFLST